MNRIALSMLFGDRAKFVTLVVGLSFAVLLIAQQGAIFLGLVLRSTGALQNTVQPDLWVADPNIAWVSEIRPLSERDLLRVRSVAGVAWAQPYFSARALVELPDGTYKTAQIIGLDRSTLVGQPPMMVEGSLDALRAPDAVVIEESSRDKLANVNIGDTLRLNDQRAVVVGFCRAKTGFDSNALIYTTIDNALEFVPVGREAISFYLVKVQPGVDRDAVARAIEDRTGLGAFTLEQLRGRSVNFVLTETGIGINFGITVFLGFLVGLAIVGSVLYQFTLENLPRFAVLKAMGTSNLTLIRMVLLQSLIVGVIGYGIGVGGAAVFSLMGRKPGAELAVYFPWQLMVVSLGAMLFCVMLGSFLSLKRVITLEPAVVFK